MIFKSYIIEKNLDSVNKCKMLLFYGENEGLKKNFKERLKKISVKSDILNLYQNELIENPKLLINEVLNKSLFENNKTIFINEANDKILPLLEELNDHLEKERIYIFSNILDKKSKLRSYFEKHKEYGICACYQDTVLTIRKIIEEKLKSYEGLSNSIVNLIIESAGVDRNKIDNEISKIESFFYNKKLDYNNVDELLNVKTNEDFNKLKDEALNGNKINTNKLLADTIFEPEKNILYINSINQRIVKLKQINDLKTQGEKTEDIISKLKPPVFWKDKPVLIEQSKKWNKSKLNTALKKTYDLELKIKSNSNIHKDILFKNLIVELCVTASSS